MRIINRKIEVVPYDYSWPSVFETEANQINNILGDRIHTLHHIGSTSIPNMPAKPVIDMLLELKNLDDIKIVQEKLLSLGFNAINRQMIPHRSFICTKDNDGKRFINLHIYEQGDPQAIRHINFRDYLICHMDDAHAYAELKKYLAKKYIDDMNKYVSGKDRLVQTIDVKAKHWAETNSTFVLSAVSGLNTVEWSKEKVIKCVAANFNVFKTHYAQYIEHVTLLRNPGITVVDSGLLDAELNYVIDADYYDKNVETSIGQVTQYFSTKKLPFSWWVSPYDKPDNLDEILIQNGYGLIENKTALYLDLDTWEVKEEPISQLKIARVMDEKTWQDFLSVVNTDKTTFKKYYSWISSILTKNDPVEYYVGYIDGEPVARSESCYYAGVVGLFGLKTKADKYVKTYEVEMQIFQLKQAKIRGYHIAYLLCLPEVNSFYMQLGFKECGSFRNFQNYNNISENISAHDIRNGI